MDNKINNKETDKAVTIPYFDHEWEMARLERIIKKLWITVILLILLLVGTNGVWIWYESQFEDVVLTQEATTDSGGDAIVSGTATGDINNYGQSKTDNQNP